MKRIFSFIAAATLFGQAATFAQNSNEPSVKSVLETAREKYRAAMTEAAQASEKAVEALEDAEESEDYEATDATERPSWDSKADVDAEYPYTPILLSLVPGITIPFGNWSASIAAGPIGVIMGDVRGAAGAGIFTMSRDILGLQASGVFNMSRNVIGFQTAGVFNLAEGDVKGGQAAGVFNLVEGEVLGAQAAGVFNIANDVKSPFQIAGVFNIAKDVKAIVQGAGVFNLAEDLQGFQAAGVFNSARSVAGGQIASVVNVAKEVRGVQVGLVNVVDDLEGVQIGLVNVVKNGVNCVGALYEPETGYAYGLWQGGSKTLYTIATLGAPRGDWFVKAENFVFSLGLGSRAKIFGLNLDFDVSAAQVLGDRGAAIIEAIGTERSPSWDTLAAYLPYASARVTMGIPLGGRLQLVGGMKLDVEAGSSGRVPEALRGSRSWAGSLFRVDFVAYPKWFMGFKL